METRRVVTLSEFGGPEVLRWEDGPVPLRGPGDVDVAVEAIGVNFADTMVRRGEYRRDQPLSFVPGFEVAGRVLAGPDDGPAVGSRVVVFMEHGGGYADRVVAPLDHVFPVADGLSTVTAAGLFTQGVTAWYAVHRYGGRVGPGTRVLVHAAAGGLGSLCVQLAAGAGATVIGAASTEEKLALARGHGAAFALTPDVETFARDVRALTDGHGVDVVIDGVGGDLFAPTLRALAMGGRYVVVGSASQAPALLDARALMPRGQTVVGFVVARVAEEDAREPALAWSLVQDAVLRGELRPELRTLPVADAASAHRLIESRRLTGKVVLTFG